MPSFVLSASKHIKMTRHYEIFYLGINFRFVMKNNSLFGYVLIMIQLNYSNQFYHLFEFGNHEYSDTLVTKELIILIIKAAQ